MSRELQISPVIIDLGGFNIKFKSELTTDTFSSKFKIGHSTWNDKYERITYNGSEFFMGVGKYSREPQKTKRNYMPNLLLAITKALAMDEDKTYNYDGDDENREHPSMIDLCLLLPIDQMNKRDEYANALKGKLFEYNFNGYKRMISVASLTVVPEGFASFLSLPKEKQFGLVTVIDLGSKDLNYASLYNGKIENSDTIPGAGSFRFYDIVKSICEKDGFNYTDDKIPMLIASKIITEEQIELAKEIYFSELKSDINDITNVLENNLVAFTGGTSDMIRDKIKEEYTQDNVIVMENFLTSNIDGCAKMMKIDQ